MMSALKHSFRYFVVLFFLMANPPAANAQDAEANKRIDVIILYTENAYRLKGYDDGIRAYLNSLIAYTNIALENSQVDGKLRLIHSQEVVYRHSNGSVDADIDRLENPNDGILDEAHTLKDEYGADLVCLLVTDRNHYDGIANYPQALGDNTAIFSVVAIDIPNSLEVFAHEIGHNLGGGHDRDNSYGELLFPYAHGHRGTASDGTYFRTLMSYFPGVVIDYFSNPQVRYLGTPTGTPGPNPPANNNASVFQQMIPRVADYRSYRLVELDFSEKSIGSASHTIELRFTAEENWVASDYPNWIQFTPISGGPGEYAAIITIEENTLPEGRTGSIRINNSEVKIFQKGDWDSAISDTGLKFTTGGEAQWKFIVNDSDTDDNYIAAHFEHEDLGTAWLETEVAGPGIFSFRWRYVEDNGTRLDLILNGREIYLRNISQYSEEWQIMEIQLGAQKHTIRWEFKRDNITDDREAQLKEINFSPEGTFNHADLSPSGLKFLQSGMSWGKQANTTRNGRPVVAMETSEGSRYSELSTTIQGPGLLSYWRMEEDSINELAVEINGIELEDYVYENEWLKNLILIPKGKHTFIWSANTYQISRGDSSLKKAYLSDVIFDDEYRFPDEKLSQTGLKFTTYGVALWQLTDEIKSPNGLPVIKSGYKKFFYEDTQTNRNYKSGLKTIIKGPGILSYWQVNEPRNIDSVSEIAQSEWQYHEYYIPPGTHEESWSDSFPQVDKFREPSEYKSHIFLAEVNFTPEEKFDDSALSPDGLEFTYEGDAPWRIVNSPDDSNNLVAASYKGEGIGSSRIKTYVIGPGTLHYKSKLVTIRNEDRLRVIRNDHHIRSQNYTTGWQDHTVEVPKGRYSITWIYDYGRAFEGEKFGAFLDDIRFEADTFEDYYLTHTANRMEGGTGNGWYWSFWFGLFFVDNREWIYHNEYGWIYANAEGNSNTSAWIFIDSKKTWYWISDSLGSGIAFDSRASSFAIWDNDSKTWWPF